MFGLVVMEVMTPSGHLSNINEIVVQFHNRKQNKWPRLYFFSLILPVNPNVFGAIVSIKD